MLIETGCRRVRGVMRASWDSVTVERACCLAPTKEQKRMAAKLVVKFPKDVFASARQTNCIQFFSFRFSALLGYLLKLIMLFDVIIPTGIMQKIWSFHFQFGLFLVIKKTTSCGLGNKTISNSSKYNTEWIYEQLVSVKNVAWLFATNLSC